MIDRVWLAAGVALSMMVTLAVPLAPPAVGESKSNSKLALVWPAPTVIVDEPVPAAMAMLLELPESYQE